MGALPFRARGHFDGDQPDSRAQAVRGEKGVMKLSVVIPARDESGCLEETIAALANHLRGGQIPFEIVLVDDGSTDGTFDLARTLAITWTELRAVRNQDLHGFGRAVRFGLERCHGGRL